MPSMNTPGHKALDIWNVLASQMSQGDSLGWLLANAPRVIASDDLITSDDTEETTASAIYEKRKEFTVYGTGTYRVKFDLRGYSSPENGYGRIYKNGVAYGTEQVVADENFVTKSEDLIFEYGDTVELWAHTVTMNAAVKNYRLYGFPSNVYAAVSP